ncbi:hypothetical protein FA95DRAFT_1402349 [Auriscalpium vulgare]|uniref:Uncharacterized protein n=1 Tax=Auriscalpium vulgare TaxID=40419 RepID=A0ACB8RQT4_9AGAM|nr:hypothetical protein FA95DRAFT_1402349 [Auriscalpium vulgare]
MGSMQDLLRVLPSKVIKAARNGSYPAIEALSWDPLELVPDVHRPELVVLFCAHIRKTPRGPGNHDLIQQCFVGLNLLLQLPELCRIPDVLETLPTMVQWFFHSVHELDRGRGSPQLLEAYMYIIYYLVNNSELWPRVLKTPGIIEVGTAMWMRSTVCTVPEYPGAAMGFAELLVHVPDPIIDFLTASVADVGDVAVRLVFPLRVALAAHATTEHLQAYVWQLDQFSQQIPAAPFAPALLSIGAVRLVSRTLLRFSQRDMREHDSLFIVRKCLCMVHRFVEMGTGIPWVAQSVRSGLLAALASIGPQLNLLDADAQVACMALVQDVLPRYLIFRPVIKAVGKVLEKLEDGPHIGLTQSRDFADSWAALKDLAKIRVEYQESEAMMDCSSCLRRGHKSEFRRCARCRQEHYCSVACQVVHWRHEHKAHCRQWRRIVSSMTISVSTSSIFTSDGYGAMPSRSRRRSPPCGWPPFRPSKVNISTLFVSCWIALLTPYSSACADLSSTSLGVT